MIVQPQRSSCKTWITIPEGCHAVVAKHGRFCGVFTPGLHWCMPWTRIQFIVSKQNMVFDLPIRNCPTIDNILIKIDVSIVLKVKESEEDVKNFCYKTSINQLNEQLDAAISERIRVLARSVTHLEAYSVKGKEHTQEMIEYMNGIFDNKGVEIKSVIITNVTLPQ